MDDESKYWMTTDRDDRLLFEFGNRESFRNKNVSRTYLLPFRFYGNSHAIHNGHFYCQQFGSNKLMSYDLVTNQTFFRKVDDAAFQPSTSRLYESGYNYMDISADENGLWLIFASDSSSNTLVMKLDPDTLATENAWNLTADRRTAGDMIVACGILYAVHSVTDTFTRIRFAYDLFLNEVIPLSVNFTNPFSHNTFISYNPRHEKIFACDSGNLIEYPIRFTDKAAEQANDLTTDETDDFSRR
jgi:hypothetical protein